MLDGAAKINFSLGETALHVLAKSGSWDDSIPKSRRCEAIQMLLQHGADVHAVNPRGRGVLHLAVTEHDAPAIETLIEGMADVNAQDLAGFTPLMWAAGRDGADCVKMLLDCEVPQFVTILGLADGLHNTGLPD